MRSFQAGFADPQFVNRYLNEGPPAFTPGHAGLLQMAWVLLAERVPEDGRVLVVGAGGGLDTRALAEGSPGWRFTGVDPSPEMLALARQTAGPAAGDRLELIEGSVEAAPAGPYDGATLICVLGLLADDGSKLALLRGLRDRLSRGAPLILVDQCMDRDGPDFPQRLNRYLAYARASGVRPETVANAEAMMRASVTLATAERDEALLAEAGFGGVEVFYRGLSWVGWVAYA